MASAPLPSLSSYLQYGTSRESITLLYVSCPTWMQIAEGSVGKALLIKTPCRTHYIPHACRQDEQQVAHMKYYQHWYATQRAVEIKYRQMRLTDSGMVILMEVRLTVFSQTRRLKRS